MRSRDRLCSHPMHKKAKREKTTSGSQFHAREVVGDRTGVKAAENATSVSLLHAREVEVTKRDRNGGKVHLHLAVAREGGGGRLNGAETAGNSTSVSLLHAREVVGD